MSAVAVLQSIMESGRVYHPDGGQINVVANISSANSKALYTFVKERRPKLVVEIGMAYGVSTLSILSALQEDG